VIWVIYYCFHFIEIEKIDFLIFLNFKSVKSYLEIILLVKLKGSSFEKKIKIYISF